jgi:hypothetical protein
LADFASQPALAEFCLIHSFGAVQDPGESGHERAVGAVQHVIAAFFNAAEGARASSTMRSEGLARALLWQAAAKLRHNESHHLPALEALWIRLIGNYLPARTPTGHTSSSNW